MPDEPRYFVSELWGWTINVGHGRSADRQSVTATIFDRAYTPPAIVKSYKAGRAIGNTLTVRRAHQRCLELNTLHPVPEWEKTDAA